MTDLTEYPDGESLRYRCTFCGSPVSIEPHPGCCGETEAEVIPFDELDAYESVRPKCVPDFGDD